MYVRVRVCSNKSMSTVKKSILTFNDAKVGFDYSNAVTVEKTF